ncbi:hypothetical protein ANN_23263 [Periplaneta americana]|uniref:Uncharacterized protein n=1 Tax=Periplaneta americana TaxID=6978 RepID=A0ABQ8SKM1_PERAM|nr:hypothetical protein ANN_23263 [Periplaneta americana]
MAGLCEDCNEPSGSLKAFCMTLTSAGSTTADNDTVSLRLAWLYSRPSAYGAVILFRNDSLPAPRRSDSHSGSKCVAHNKMACFKHPYAFLLIGKASLVMAGKDELSSKAQLISA